MGEPIARHRPVLVFPAAHHRGGVERITWQALARLAERGPVAFVGREFEPLIAGVEFIKVPAVGDSALTPFRFRRAARSAIAAHRKLGDVVVSFGAECPPGDVVVVNSVHRSWIRHGGAVSVLGVPMPARARYLLPRHQALLACERSYFAGARSAALVTVSAKVAEDLHDLHGVDPACVTVIHNGFAPERFSPELRSSRRTQQRSEWGIGDEQIALLFVANELRRKGFDCLLDAVASLGDDRFEIHVVGRATLAGFAARITELGLASRVHYHGSMETGLAHAAADALVLPTQYEAFALTIVEALASGLPVVTTTVPGAGDLIRHRVNGLLQHDPIDHEELARLLVEISDPDERIRLGAAAADSVSGLDWATLMDRLDDVVQARGARGQTLSGSIGQ